MFYEDPTEKNGKVKKDVDEKWLDVNHITEKAWTRNRRFGEKIYGK